MHHSEKTARCGRIPNKSDVLDTPRGGVTAVPEPFLFSLWRSVLSSDPISSIVLLLPATNWILQIPLKATL